MENPTKVFSDSRGKGFSRAIYLNNSIDLEVCYYPGITTAEMKGAIKGFCKSHKVGAAYIMVGINNLTIKDISTGTYVLKFDTPEKIRDEMMDLLIDLSRYCKTECNIKHVIICTLPGMDLARYNSLSTRADTQTTLDKGIQLLNENITTLNAGNGYSTPMIHQYIHPTLGNSRRARNTYSRLRDGLHPTTHTLSKWSQAMIASMRLNAHLE